MIEFRASIIIGSGSLSFEIIRALVERLPVMICPKWVATPAQPIAVEDVGDFWRVEAFEPDRLLRLRAEMKLPGRAWLEFEVTEDEQKHSTIRQTALFDPLGLFGLACW